MTDKKLFILGIVAVVMVVLAVITSSVPDKKGGEATGLAYLIQGVNPDNIASIEVKSGDDVVTLKRKQSKFVVAEKSDYPAMLSKVNSLISDVLDIKTVELFTDKASNHTDLGVTEGNAAYVVRFLKPDGTELTGVVVGRNKEKGQGTFIRLTSDDRVYITLDRLNLPTKPVGFTDQTLVSADSGEIKIVRVTSNRSKYMLQRDDSGDLVADKTPVGKKLKATDVAAVFNALSSLLFEDVVKEGVENLTFDKKYRCTLKDSTQYTLNIATDGDKTFVKCSAEFTDKSQVTIERGGSETEEELKAKEAKLIARDSAKDFAKARAGWVYEISADSAGKLTKSLDDLLEDKTPVEGVVPPSEKMLGPTIY